MTDINEEFPLGDKSVAAAEPQGIIMKPRGLGITSIPVTGEIVDAPKVEPASKSAGAVAVKPADPIKALLMSQKAALHNFLGTEANAMRFLSSVMHSLQQVPKLRECTHGSLIGAFMECAALGLYPDNVSGDCYVLPYADGRSGKILAQFQIGYRGLKTLAYRAGIRSCGTEVVYANDKFKEYLGTSPRIEHEKALDDRGLPIGAYAWAEIASGAKVFKYMTKKEIFKIKAMSKSGKNDKGPWASGDPMFWMWQKTVFKQLAKLLPTSEKVDGDKFARAIHADNAVERGGCIIGPEREIIDVPFEESNDDKIDSVKAKKEGMRKSKK